MLNRLRPAALDIAAFLFLLVALSTGIGWMLTVALVYAGLIVVMRIATIFARIAPPVSEAPEGLFHALYGGSVAASVLAQNWTLAAAWVAVWGLSFVSSRRASAPSAIAAAAAKKAARITGSSAASKAATGAASTGAAPRVSSRGSRRSG